jgi:hypothetical protein
MYRCFFYVVRTVLCMVLIEKLNIMLSKCCKWLSWCQWLLRHATDFFELTVRVVSDKYCRYGALQIIDRCYTLLLHCRWLLMAVNTGTFMLHLISRDIYMVVKLQVVFMVVI